MNYEGPICPILQREHDWAEGSDGTINCVGCGAAKPGSPEAPFEKPDAQSLLVKDRLKIMQQLGVVADDPRWHGHCDQQQMLRHDLPDTTMLFAWTERDITIWRDVLADFLLTLYKMEKQG